MASQVFTTTGSQVWNWPPATTTVTAEAIGGGGGGGTASGNPATGGGGKGGSYAKIVITKGAEVSLTLVVGAGGAIAGAGAASTVVQGGTTVLSAAGGGGGATQATSSANGAGGTTLNGANTGTTTFAGGNGGTGNFTAGTQGSGAGGGAAGPTSVGGAASVNTLGSAGTGTFLNGTAYQAAGKAGVANSTPGVAGGTYGGGASGGKANTGADQNGAVGAQGIIVLTYTGADQAVTTNTIASGSIVRAQTVATTTTYPLKAAAAFVTAHWTLDETTGTRIDTRAGLAASEVSGTITGVAGKFEQSVPFVDEQPTGSRYLHVDNTAAIQPTTNQAWMFRAWFKVTSLPAGGHVTWIFHKAASDTDYGLYVAIGTNGVVSVYVRLANGTDQALGGFSPALGQWVLLHVWVETNWLSGGMANNGQPTTLSFNSSSSYVTTNGPLHVGAAAPSGNWGWKGEVDDLLIMKGYRLTNAEILIDYQSGQNSKGLRFLEWDPTAPKLVFLPRIESTVSLNAPVVTLVDQSVRGAFIGAGAAAAGPFLIDGLVSYWTLDETSGTANDLHGLNPLTDVTTTGSAAGKVGTARSFASDYLSHVNNADFRIPNLGTSYSFACWVKTNTTAGYQTVLAKRFNQSTGNGLEYMLRLDLGVMAWYWGNSGVGYALITVPGTLAVGTWHFVVCGFNAATGKFFLSVNGAAPVESGVITDQNLGFANDFFLGSSTAGEYFDGVIDEVGFWKRLLTAPDIAALYNGGTGLSYNDFSGKDSLRNQLQGYWKCDETLSSSNLVDAHGGTPLTRFGAPGVVAGKLGTARQMVGSSNYFVSASPAPRALTLDSDTPFTWSTWVYLTDRSVAHPLISKFTSDPPNATEQTEYQLVTGAIGGAYDGILVIISNGVGGTWTYALSGSPPLNAWMHVVFWHDPVANTISIQINGGTPVSVPWANGTQGSGGPLYVGLQTNVGTLDFAGNIDETGFWKRVLTSGERSALYNSGNGLSYDLFVLAAGGGATLFAPSVEVSPLFASTQKLSPNGNDVTTDPIDTTNASLIVWCVQDHDYFHTFTMSDSKANTWLPIGTYGTVNGQVSMFYCLPPSTKTGPGHTFTRNGDTYPGSTILCFKGTYEAVFEAQIGLATNDQVTTFSPGTITPAFVKELFITLIDAQDPANVLTIDSGFFIAHQAPTNPGLAAGHAVATKVHPTTAALTPTWTYNIPTFFPEAMLVGFRTLVGADQAVVGSFIGGGGAVAFAPTDITQSAATPDQAVSAAFIGVSPLRSQLVSYWKLDEVNGTAIDAHGTNTLTDENFVGSGTGKIGLARLFDSAAGNRLTHADNPDLSVGGDTDFAFSCWVKFARTPGSGQLTPIAKYDIAANQRAFTLIWQPSPDDLGWFVSPDGVTVTYVKWGVIPTPGVWYHMVCWHDSVANQIGLSVNNGTPVTTAFSAGVFNDTAPFVLGALWSGGNSLPSSQMDGLVDEVGFWKRMLTPAERTALFNGGAGLSYDAFAGSGGGATVFAPTVTGGAVILDVTLLGPVFGQASPGDTTTAVTAPLDTTGATLVMVAVAYYGNDIDGTNGKGPLRPGYITDSKGNGTPVELLDRRSQTGGNAQSGVKVFYWPNPTSVGPGHYFTVDTSTYATYPAIMAVGLVNAAIVAPVSAENGTNADGANLTSVNVGSIAALPGDFALTFINVGQAGVAGLTAPAGFTIPAGGAAGLVSGAAFGLAMATKTNAGTVTNPTWTAATDIRSAEIVSIKSAADKFVVGACIGGKFNSALVSYWPMDEVAGSAALDVHGSNWMPETGSNAALHIGSNTGVVATAREFLGYYLTYFSHASDADLVMGDIDFTVSVWVWFDSLTATQFFLCKDDAASVREYGVFYDSADGRLKFYVFTPSGVPVVLTHPTFTPVIDTWTHVVGWHDAAHNEIAIAINGGTPVTMPHADGVKAGTAIFTIGAVGNGSGGVALDGRIDEAALWKRVLAADERTALYGGGSGLSYAALSSLSNAVGAQAFAPTVASVEGVPDQAVSAATVASTAQVFAPTAVPGAVTVTTPGRATTLQVFAPVVLAMVFGATIPVGSGVFTPSVALNFSTGTIVTTLAVRVPTVVVGPVAVTTASVTTATQVFTPTLGVGATAVTTVAITTTGQLFVPTVAPGAVVVTTPGRATTIQAFPPTLTPGSVTLTAGTSAPTAQLFALSVTTGPVTVLATTRSTTAQLFALAVAPGAVTVVGATVAAGGQRFAPVLSAQAAGATIPSGSGVFAPSVLAVVFVTTATQVTTAQVFTPTVAVAGVLTVGMVQVAPTAQFFGVTITVGSVAVVGATVTSTLQLNLPIVSLAGVVNVGGGTVTTTAQGFAVTVAPQPVVVVMATRPTTSAVFAPTLTEQTVGATIVSGSGVFVPTLIQNVTAVTRTPTLQMFVPSVSTGAVTVVAPTITTAGQVFTPIVNLGAVGVVTVVRPSTIQMFAAALAAQLTSGTRSTTAALFAPALSAGVTSGTVGIATAAFPPTVLPSGALGGQTVPTTLQMFAPATTAGAVTVIGGTRVSTLAISAPSLTPVIATPALSSTAQVFALTVLPGPVTVGGVTVTATSIGFAPMVVAAAVTVGGAHVSSTAHLFLPVLTPGFTLGFITSTSDAFAPAVLPGAATVSTSFIGSILRLFAPAMGLIEVCEHFAVEIETSGTWGVSVTREEAVSLAAMTALDAGVQIDRQLDLTVDVETEAELTAPLEMCEAL